MSTYDRFKKLLVLRPPVEPGQYTSVRLTEHLALEEIRPSIGSVGDAYDCEHPVVVAAAVCPLL